MGYSEFIKEQIVKYRKSEPIYSKTLAIALQNRFQLPYDKAVAACAVTMSRLLKENAIPELRMYQKGIYYLTVKTLFGEMGINTERLIEDKYIRGNMGYEGGLSLLHKVGLTTQMPRERLIVTNNAKNGQRADRQLNVYIRPPKIAITAENRAYLQTLDMLDLMGNAPVDVENPYEIVAEHMAREKIKIAELLAIADEYYPKDTIIRIAHVARVRGGELF